MLILKIKVDAFISINLINNYIYGGIHLKIPYFTYFEIFPYIPSNQYS